MQYKMSYIVKYISTKPQLELELSQRPDNIKYYAKYDTFVGDSDAMKYLDSKIQEYFQTL